MLNLSPQAEAHVYATGRTAVIIMGTLGVIAVCLVALWLVLQLALVLLTTLVASCNELAGAFASADPLVKLLLFGVFALVVWQLVEKWREKRA